VIRPPSFLPSVFALLFAGASAAFAADATTTAAPDAHALRAQAQSIFGILPDKAPGADKDTSALVELGRTLFFDVRLSVNNSQSCNSCHAVDRERGGADTDPFSLGAKGKRGGRNSPTVLNASLQTAQFWDGRAGDLAAQAKGPILNPVEMGMPNEHAVIEKLRVIPGYAIAFGEAFKGELQPMTYDNLARAIAAFERTLVTHDRFDDFLKGNDQALKADELAGLEKFVSVGCIACHNGPLLGGNSFQKIGLVNPY
jgi:cytochrome c peroxidase